jgi:hypothetical protein
VNSDVRDPSDVISEARATLDAWRARGVDRMDPVRFHFTEALVRRAAGHSGEARRILDNRLHSLLTAYAADLEQTALAASDAGVEGGTAQLAMPLPLPVRGTLGELLDQIAGRAPSAQSEGSAAGRAASQPASWPELEMLEYFREVWSRLDTERQLRQSQQQVPGNAGPLNSSSLVHRSLSLMRELSPGYLQQFLSYVDALSWMEQMNSGGPLPGKDTPRAAGAKKSTRGASR